MTDIRKRVENFVREYRKAESIVKARRLKALVIDEVSSVDRGAGRGVAVKFIKSEDRSMQADFLKAVEHAIMHAPTPDQAATIAFRAENVLKARVRDDANPTDAARNAKLAWIDAEAKRLVKMGGRSTTQAINEAMRNWAGQNNSPGQR